VAAQAAGDEIGARTRLQEAIDAIERQSASFASPETRATLYETVERVFDATIRIELANKRPDSAFAYLERGRVAAWAPDARLAVGTRRTPASLTRIRELLPGDAVFVEYALLPDTLAMWIVSSRGSRLYAGGVRRDSVAQLVDRFTREMGGPDVDTTSARARLFDLLLAPFASELAGSGEIVVVRTGSWRACRSPRSGIARLVATYSRIIGFVRCRAPPFSSQRRGLRRRTRVRARS
jgi:hypothetical protein